VIVDFSLASALPGLLTGAEACGASLVIGTTGYTEAQRDSLAQYAERQPVVCAANFSVGIPLLKLALQMLARALPAGFMAEQVETHHRHKQDRPSGTARWLAEAWQTARGDQTPPTHSLRLGGITGEHAWTISDDHETLQLVHRAHSREAFLRGVPPAVRFVATQRAGLFSLADVFAVTAVASEKERARKV
jgi:4-hydroxy-tetrahydrodipicolinate reductase